ncbi:hypothetical protein DEO72_LG7g1272 [Vigna unguiculata]|uniref:Uncharacterized protein n=1 Tax=Vigna unguiculata TaxID=3917 RepID=A0A4D6MF46_VIGUN|nr:hypothetical protein DEO72_LG7g1272 [Vigna unguiculata]
MAATINTTAPLRSRCSSATIFNLLHHLAGKQQRREPPSPSATAARLRPPHFRAAPSSPQRHQHRDQLSFHHLQPTQICRGINHLREHHWPPPQICTGNALSLRLAPASSCQPRSQGMEKSVTLILEREHSATCQAAIGQSNWSTGQH